MAGLDDEDIIDGSDEEQEDITPADILHKLKQVCCFVLLSVTNNTSLEKLITSICCFLQLLP